MSANDRQVGGSHYRQMGAAPGDQHWDRQWRLYGRGYFIGQITRYAERYHEKNGLEDLKKINHYTEKLIELEEAWANGTGPAPGSLAHNGPLKGLAYLHASDTPLKGCGGPPPGRETCVCNPLGACPYRDTSGVSRMYAEVDPDVVGAVARGWCDPKNSGKVLDPDLAFAIGREVQTLLSDKLGTQVPPWAGITVSPPG